MSEKSKSEILVAFPVALVLGIVLILAAFGTWFFPELGDERIRASYVTEFPMGVSIAASALVAVVLVMAMHAFYVRFLREDDGLSSDSRLLIMIFSAMAFIISLSVVLFVHPTWHSFMDSHQMMSYARECASGDWSTFYGAADGADSLQDNGLRYFMFYPFQAGMFWVLYLFFKFFGSNAVLMFCVANSFAVGVSAFLVCKIADLMSNGSRGIVFFTGILVETCVPFALLALFPYGNVIGFMFAMMFLTVQASAYMESDARRRALMSLSSFAPLSLALIVKPTYVLLAIGAVCAWLVRPFCSQFDPDATLSRRVAYKALDVMMCVVAILVASAVQQLPIGLLEGKIGKSLGDGMPSASWVEIGLTESEYIDGNMGWWDGAAIDAFIASEGDSEAQSDMAIASISDRVDEMMSDPYSTLLFFASKIGSEWCEPTYQSVYYAELTASSSGENIGDMIQSMGAEHIVSVSVILADIMQNVLYMLAFASLFMYLSHGEHSPIIAFLSPMFFVGFGCYALWEAKSVYILPFAILLMPIAASCFASAASRNR